MATKGQMLQDPFLNALRKEHVPLLRNTSVTQMVYKHAISTIVPARAVSLQPPAEQKPAADAEQ